MDSIIYAGCIIAAAIYIGAHVIANGIRHAAEIRNRGKGGGA